MKRRFIIQILPRSFILLFFALAVSTTVSFASQDKHKAEQRDLLQRTGSAVIFGKVTEVINVTGISYVEIDTGEHTIWSAGPASTSISAGDMVSFPATAPMRNFHSKSLDRDFPEIYFVKQYITDKDKSGTSEPGGKTTGQQPAAPSVTSHENLPGSVPVGGVLREMTLDALNGNDKMLSDYLGKPLIINVWASWCGPCQAEMGSLERLAKRFNGKAFNIIGVSTDDYRDRAATFIEHTDISFDNFIDHQLLLENMFGVKILPLTLLVDANGRVLQKVSGSREWDRPEIIQAIGEVFHIRLM